MKRNVVAAVLMSIVLLTQSFPVMADPGVGKTVMDVGAYATGKQTQNDGNSIISEEEHRWDTGVMKKKASCTEDGVMEFHCVSDGCTARKEIVIPATGHYWNEGTVIKQPTCTETGTRVKHCTNTECYAEKTVTIPAKGHGLVEVRNKREATCTTDGYTGDTYCFSCMQRIETGAVVKATGHTYGEMAVTRVPTAVKDGERQHTCTKCNHMERFSIERVAATGHLDLEAFPLKVKKSYVLTATDLAVDDRVVSWRSSDSKIATVTPGGKVTGKKSGAAIIYANLASGKTLRSVVKVQKGNVKTNRISVTDTAVVLKVKKGFQIKAARFPVTSNEGIVYSSTNKKIVTVSKKGWVMAKKKTGKARICVKSGKTKVYIAVKVIK